MLWGRPAWGVWWTWDARLTSTALLLVMLLGYMALRAVPSDPDTRARRSAESSSIPNGCLSAARTPPQNATARIAAHQTRTQPDAFVIARLQE
jgi:hypothetical protein